MVLNNYGYKINYAGGVEIDRAEITDLQINEVIYTGDVTIPGNLAVLGNITSPTITSIQSSLDSLTASVSVLSTGVSTNSTNIATNTANILTNEASILSNTTDITDNTSDIASNSTNIATNTTNIATNATDLSSNTTNIGTNTSNISTNTADIATNLSGIQSNSTQTATNSTNITTNASDLTTISDKPSVRFFNTTTFVNPTTFFTFPDRLNNTNGASILLISSNRTIVLEANKRYLVNVVTRSGCDTNNFSMALFITPNSGAGTKTQVDGSINTIYSESTGGSFFGSYSGISTFIETTSVTWLGFEISGTPTAANWQVQYLALSLTEVLL